MKTMTEYGHFILLVMGMFLVIMISVRILCDLTALVLPSLTGKYSLMDRTTRNSIIGKIVSTIHGILAVILALDALYSCKSEPGNSFLESDKCLFEVSAKQRTSATFTAGYMFYDFTYVVLFFGEFGAIER